MPRSTKNRAELPPRLYTGPRATRVRIARRRMTVDLVDGRTLIVPLSQIPGFDRLPPRAFAGYGIRGRGIGIYFPAIDEEVGVENLLHPELVLTPRVLPRLVEHRPSRKKRKSA